jgi:hypothetical protein
MPASNFGKQIGRETRAIHIILMATMDMAIAMMVASTNTIPPLLTWKNKPEQF